MQRWQLDVPLEEIGVETQRQWPEAAIRCTTPAVLGFFSPIARVARERTTGPMARRSSGLATLAACHKKKSADMAGIFPDWDAVAREGFEPPKAYAS